MCKRIEKNERNLSVYFVVVRAVVPTTKVPRAEGRSQQGDGRHGHGSRGQRTGACAGDQQPREEASDRQRKHAKGETRGNERVLDR